MTIIKSEEMPPDKKFFVAFLPHANTLFYLAVALLRCLADKEGLLSLTKCKNTMTLVAAKEDKFFGPFFAYLRDENSGDSILTDFYVLEMKWQDIVSVARSEDDDCIVIMDNENVFFVELW